ncbi:undecaprenyl-phosphate glucose phosphotransferase [Microbulbifer yueqingensis]|uniref:Putative colanic acid biosysnthesis UDP-glucose lipid carrier transferase n=1 Tax=Microbulbifer yueqingensis TaxID=658219 RepID=A0A1G8VN42_9GAMM|nr:undecaprenyl-phosphate glucose phosphotransferase [Microbulbifer yueqingensis]SDJ66610.1 putative colanic acid biosysnthesis UDP-glucose lipid carrier transferase [Microbulbifer yueqingensis]
MTQGLIRSHQSSLAALYRLLDAVLILSMLAFWCVYFGQPLSTDWLVVGLLGAVLFAFFAESVELYRSWRADTYAHMLGLTLAAWAAVCACLLVLGYFSKEGVSYSRLVIGSWFVSTLFLLSAWRYVFRRLLFFLRSRDHNTRTAVVLGVTEAGAKLARDMAAAPHHGIRVGGFYRVQGSNCCGEAADKAGLPVLGDVQDALAAARAGELDLVYIALPLREEERIAEILRDFADTTATVHLVTDLFFNNLLHTRWYHVGGTSLLSLYDTPIEGVNGWLKRLEDLVLSSVILVLISPLMLLIALGIKLTSKGPVIFKQHRYGLDGRPIKVWKFRSMTTQDNGSKVVQASRNDARITPFGRFLRRTSLDELPQFFNVLQGRMSIVGPRPHAVAHNEQYRALVDGYMLRHKVKPGITGWAQVNGWRGETETVEKMSKRVEHDLHYIRNWSLWLDLRIVFMTVFRGFTGSNAY